jgi:hypothetical protein
VPFLLQFNHLSSSIRSRKRPRRQEQSLCNSLPGVSHPLANRTSCFRTIPCDSGDHRSIFLPYQAFCNLTDMRANSNRAGSGHHSNASVVGETSLGTGSVNPGSLSVGNQFSRRNSQSDGPVQDAERSLPQLVTQPQFLSSTSLRSNREVNTDKLFGVT